MTLSLAACGQPAEEDVYKRQEVTMSAYFTYQWQCAEDEDYRVLPTREEFEELLTLWEQGAEKREELAAV